MLSVQSDKKLELLYETTASIKGRKGPQSHPSTGNVAVECRLRPYDGDPSEGSKSVPST